MPSPPRILETKIQLSDPMTFTTKLAMVNMKVPLRNFSPARLSEFVMLLTPLVRSIEKFFR